MCLKKLLTKHIHDHQSDLKQTDHDENRNRNRKKLMEFQAG